MTKSKKEQCKHEHLETYQGAECCADCGLRTEMFNPKTQRAKWEEEFNYRFSSFFAMSRQISPDFYENDIKSFISNLLAEERKRIIEEIEKRAGLMKDTTKAKNKEELIARGGYNWAKKELKHILDNV